MAKTPSERAKEMMARDNIKGLLHSSIYLARELKEELYIALKHRKVNMSTFITGIIRADVSAFRRQSK